MLLSYAMIHHLLGKIINSQSEGTIPSIFAQHTLIENTLNLKCDKSVVVHLIPFRVGNGYKP
jgi:hypothetical protein